MDDMTIVADVKRSTDGGWERWANATEDLLVTMARAGVIVEYRISMVGPGGVDIRPPASRGQE